MQKHCPTFTVVIPTYNRAGFISSSIESVLKGVYEDCEVIVVDDGSTDETQSVVTAIDDPRVQYLFQKNSERAAARNLGARNASGDYVTFLDSDDVLYRHHLDTAVKAISKFSEPAIFHLGFDIKDKTTGDVKSFN